MKFHYLSLSVLLVLFQYSSSDIINDHYQLAALECPAENPEDDVLLPAGDCEHFYKCNEGTPVLQSCPPGLHWSDELKRCEYPETANCQHGSTTARVSTTKHHHRPTTRPPRPTRPTRPTTRPPRPTTAQPPKPTCPAENSDEDVLLPAEDCEHFYKCDRGEPVLQKCPSGLHWSVAQNRCEYPEIAGCESDDSYHHRPTTRPPRPTRTTRPPRPTRTTRPPRPTTRPPRPTTRPPRPTTTTTRPTTAQPPNPTCPAENSDEDVLLPAEDCAHFYKCDHGEPVLQKCPSGLHWSVALNRCEYPEIAGCESDDSYHHRPTTRPPRPTRTTRPPRPTRTTRPPRPTTRPTRPPRPTTRPPRPTTEPPKTTTVVPPKPICPAENSEEDVFYPGEKCHEYYICDHGELVKQECPSGLHWSVTENRCEYPQLAGCA